MQSPHAAAILELHGAIYAVARRADQEGAAFLGALEAGDRLAAQRARQRYRSRLREMAVQIDRLDAMLDGADAGREVGIDAAEFGPAVVPG